MTGFGYWKIWSENIVVIDGVSVCSYIRIGCLMFSVSFVVLACQRYELLHQNGDISLDTSFRRQDSSPDFESSCRCSGAHPVATELVPRALFLEISLASYLPTQLRRVLLEKLNGFLDIITRTILGKQYRSFSSSLCSFFHFPVASSLLDPNILLSTLFWNTLSLRSSLSVSDQVSHPYNTTGKARLLLFLILRLRMCSAAHPIRHTPSWLYRQL